MPGLPVPHQLPEFTETQRPSSQWCHPAISSSVIPFSSCPQSFPASDSFPKSQLFTLGGQSTGLWALASFLPKNPRADLLQNGLVGFPCSPRDSQESSPTPQFKNINSLALSLLHIPTLTSIHDHRVSHEADLVFPSLSEFSTVYCDPHSQIFGIVNKAEIDVFLELSCFFDDPEDVGNLISGSFVFSKTSLNIWKFTVHVLLKSGLQNFKHYFTRVWDECNCVVVSTLKNSTVRHVIKTINSCLPPCIFPISFQSLRLTTCY